jgi:hypothetical protein
MNIKDYKKQEKNKQLVITTINIEKKQLTFIKKNKINLSALIRDLIKDLMVGQDNKGD